MAGRILVDSSALTFDGAGRGRKASRRISFAGIASSRLGRGAHDRIGGRPALVLELNDGETIRIATPELGALHELAEALPERAVSGDEPQRDVALVDDGTVLRG